MNKILKRKNERKQITDSAHLLEFIDSYEKSSGMINISAQATGLKPAQIRAHFFEIYKHLSS